MSNETDKKKEQKEYQMSQVSRDTSFDFNCRRNGDSYSNSCWSGEPGRERFFCKNCYRVGNQMKNCPTCNATTARLDPRARVPRKNASKKKWQQFFANFFPDLLDRMD